MYHINNDIKALPGDMQYLNQEIMRCFRVYIFQIIKLWFPLCCLCIFMTLIIDIGLATLLYFLLCIPIVMGAQRAISASDSARIDFVRNLANKRYLYVISHLLILLSILMASFSLPWILFMWLLDIRPSACLLVPPESMVPAHAALAVFAATVVYLLPYGFVLVDDALGVRRDLRDIRRVFTGRRLTLAAWFICASLIGMAALPLDRIEIEAYLHSSPALAHACRIARVVIWSVFYLAVCMAYGVIHASLGHVRPADAPGHGRAPDRSGHVG